MTPKTARSNYKKHLEKLYQMFQNDEISADIINQAYHNIEKMHNLFDEINEIKKNHDNNIR